MPPLGMDGVTDCIKTSPSHADFGRSTSKGVGTQRSEPKIGEHWGSTP